MATTNFRIALRTLVPVAVAALAAAGCGSSDSDANSKSSGSAKGPHEGDRISLVAFSTPREAYEELIPQFQETKEGEGVEFDQSYGAAGEQARAIVGGLPTDYTHLAGYPDIQKVIEAGQVGDAWDDGEHKGFVTDSTVAIVVRKGNPKGIKTWDDLLEKGVEVVTPNPFTSGGARWNLMAAYGAWTRAGDSQDEALGKLEQLLRNTPVQSKSAREALQVFASGKGDAMLAYEQEAIQAEGKGEDFEHFVPDSTILIENPAAVLDASKVKDAAQAWLDFLYSDEAQQTWAKYGYRPVVEGAAEAAGVDFPQPKDLFTIEDVGGWDSVMDEFFDRDNGHVAKIEKKLGVSTDG
jgi:sulfate transport system substrate-binding protein